MGDESEHPFTPSPYDVIPSSQALLLQVPTVDPACLAGDADVEIAVGLRASQGYRAARWDYAQNLRGSTRLSTQVHVIGGNRLRPDRRARIGCWSQCRVLGRSRRLGHLGLHDPRARRAVRHLEVGGVRPPFLTVVDDSQETVLSLASE